MTIIAMPVYSTQLIHGHVLQLAMSSRWKLNFSTCVILLGSLAPSNSSTSTQYTSQTSDSSGDTQQGLPLVGIYGITIGIALIIIITCIFTSLICAYKWRKRRRSRVLLYKPVHVDANGSSRDYIAFGTKKPHFIGPENLSQSGNYTVPNSLFKSKWPVSEKPKDEEFHGIDTTRVVYSDLLARDDRILHGSDEFPSSTEKLIDMQLKNNTLKRSEIEIDKKNPGKAVWKKGEDLVKVHLRKSSAEKKMKFLEEAATMAQFKHPNIILFYGILNDISEVTIIEELLHSNLKSFLQTIKPKPKAVVPRGTPKLLLNFSQQIALGMKYLSTKNIVHGKIMASSIMVSDTKVCKITDFSLSKDISDENFWDLDVPVKWSAPEVINYNDFSTASDVWSYGCLLYEVWSLGRQPYEGESNMIVIESLKLGRRLAPPPGCPKVIYGLMMQAWNPETSQRPSFSSLVNDLTGVESLILNIPQDLMGKHPQCAQLGGLLSFGKLMYQDMQTLYTNSSDTTIS